MREILFLILITFSTVASGTNYYISNSGNDSSNGQSHATAWKTLKNVNTQKFNPGDSILFERGGIWNENLEITSSGSSAGQITYSAYGTGDKPVFNGIGEVEGWTTAGNWTNMGNNVWRINISHAGIYGRVWIDNTEAVHGNRAAEGQGLSSERRWQKINNRLYIYSTSNPASAFTSLKITSPSAFYSATDRNYITLNNLEIRGWQVITMRGCSNWIIEYCDIIRSGMRGFDIRRNGNTFTTNGVIRHCNFDTEFSSSEARIWGADTGDWFYFYTEYAIQINDGGVYDWDINDNNFKNWGYTTFWFTNHKDGYYTEGLRFFRNFVDNTGLNYGRALGGHHDASLVSASKPIEIFDNIFKNQAVSSQVNIAYCKIYNNIFDGTITPKWPNKETSSALNPINFYSPAYEMKIFNNVFANSGYAGMFLSMTGTFENIRIVNNIFYENGYNAGWQQFRISYWPDTSSPLINPQIDNNIFYSAASPDVLYMLGKSMTVQEFNALDGNNAQNLNPKNNIYADPLFVDPENGDFRLQEGSPAIGAGLTPLSGKDMAGTEWGDNLNIGPFAVDKSKSPVEYYTLSLGNEGNGIVLSNGKEENSITVESETTITVEAIPDSGWIFSNWTGEISGSENPLEITMNTDKNITAVFTEVLSKLTIIHEGKGSVKITPAGEFYPEGTIIDLEAIAENGWYFNEWDGDLTSTNSRISFTIKDDMEINAKFNNITTNTDLEPVSEQEVNIYPNPAKDFFRIEVGGSSPRPDLFRIIDLNGKIVHKGLINKNITDVHLPTSLNSGIYIVELLLKNLNFYARKIVISK